MTGPVALVAGGAGFLGSHLCQRLLGDGYRVTCLDNLSSGRLQNVRGLLEHPGFTFERGDVRNPYRMAHVDLVLNFACPASPPRYQEDAVGTFLTNVQGTLHLLELARRHGARLLQASTSEVYGQPLVHPQPEHYLGNVNTTGPRACYDEGKRGAETLCADFERQYGADIRIARIFNTYGPRMAPDDGRVVSNFIVQALRDEPLTVYGDGLQTRSFCYVDDLVEGLLRLAGSSVRGPVNLGNDDERSVVDLAHQVLHVVGRTRSRVVYRHLPTDDPTLRRPDLTKARQQLSWEPTVDLRNGLGKTVDHFRQQLHMGRRLAS